MILVELQRLDLDQNAITSLAPLAMLTQMVDLEASQNELTSLVGLENMSSTVDFHQHPKKARLVLWVARESGDFERLHEQSVFDLNYRRTAGRDWIPFEVDLSAYAGETLTVRLEFEVDRRLKPDLVSWFGSPRIAARPSIE